MKYQNSKKEKNPILVKRRLYQNWTWERETSSSSGARVLQMLTNVALLHSPDEGCSGTTEILGKYGDNKRPKRCTGNRVRRLTLTDVEVLSKLLDNI